MSNRDHRTSCAEAELIIAAWITEFLDHDRQAHLPMTAGSLLERLSMGGWNLVHGDTPVPDDDCEVARLEREVAQLRRALENRELIGMAQGIIIARKKCPPDTAFKVLSSASQRANRRVADIAGEMVARNSGPIKPD